MTATKIFDQNTHFISFDNSNRENETFEISRHLKVAYSNLFESYIDFDVNVETIPFLIHIKFLSNVTRSLYVVQFEPA